MPLDNVEFQNDIYDNKVTFPEQEVYTFSSVDPQEDDFALLPCCPPGCRTVISFTSSEKKLQVESIY